MFVSYINPPMQIAESLPRICFLSGLTGEEMMMFIDAFPETGTYKSKFQMNKEQNKGRLLRHSKTG